MQSNTKPRSAKRGISLSNSFMVSVIRSSTRSAQGQSAASRSRTTSHVKVQTSGDPPRVRAMHPLIVCLMAVLLAVGCAADTGRSEASKEQAPMQANLDNGEMAEPVPPESKVITIDTTQQVRISAAEADSLLAGPGIVSICSRLDSLWVTNALGEKEAQSSPTVLNVVSGAYQFVIEPHRIIDGMVDNRTYRRFAVDGMLGLSYDKGLFREGTCGLLSMDTGPNWTDFIFYGRGGNSPKQARFAEGMLSLHLIDGLMVIDLQSKTGRITYKARDFGRIRIDSLAEPISIPQPLSGAEVLHATQKLPKLSMYECDQVKVYTDGSMLRKSFRHNIYPHVFECINFIEKTNSSDNPDSFETEQVGVRKRHKIEFLFHRSMTG